MDDNAQEMQLLINGEAEQAQSSAALIEAARSLVINADEPGAEVRS